MIELTQKKIGKLIGLKKSDFNDLIKSKQIILQKPRLIPTYKVGDEMALTSVLLSSLRLIKVFKDHILSDAKMQKGGVKRDLTPLISYRCRRIIELERISASSM